MSDDSTTNTLSNTADLNYLVPVTIDKEPIIFEDNDATIEGILYEVGRFYKRTGLFQMLFKHRAVPLSNGKLAVESVNTVWYTSGKITDPRDFNDVCPPTTTRYANTVRVMTRAGSTVPPDLTDKGVPKQLEHSVILAPHHVEASSALLLKSLGYVFGSAESVENLFDDADGCGLKLLELLRDRATKASPRDKALIAATHARIVREGVSGENTLPGFKSFLKEYKKAKRNLPAAVRQTPEAEVEMINLVAAKDPASREIYELRAEAKPPTTLAEASDILLLILRGRVRAEQIDEVTTGAKPLALAAATAGGGGNAASTGAESAIDQAIAAALASIAPGAGLAGTTALAAHLKAALAATLQAVPDPRKTRAGHDPNKPKVEVPRGADNKPLRWVEGMALCRCGVNGGKHLFKDCPKKAEKDKKAKAAKDAAKAAAAAAGDDTAGTAAVANGGGAEDSLSRQLAALLASISPATAVVPGASEPTSTSTAVAAPGAQGAVGSE